MDEVEPRVASKCDEGGRKGRTRVDMNTEGVMGVSMVVWVLEWRWWWRPKIKALWKVSSISGGEGGGG